MENDITISTPDGQSVVTNLDGMRRAADVAARGQRQLTLFVAEAAPDEHLLKIKAGKLENMQRRAADLKRAGRGRGSKVYLVVECRIDEVAQTDKYDAEGFRDGTVQTHTATILDLATVDHEDAQVFLEARFAEADAS